MNPASWSSARHSACETQASSIVVSESGPRNDSVSTRLARVPVGALEDSRLALQPPAVRLLDVLAARREHVEDEAATGHEQVVGGAQRLQPLRLAVEMEIGPEGAQHERDALGDGRPAVVAEPQIELPGDAREVCSLAADLEHARRGVDADHGDPRRRHGNGDAARADPELDHRPGRRARGLLDVEGDVLDDAAAPRVVEPGDRVVGLGRGGFRLHGA